MIFVVSLFLETTIYWDVLLVTNVSGLVHPFISRLDTSLKSRLFNNKHYRSLRTSMGPRPGRENGGEGPIRMDDGGALKINPIYAIVGIYWVHPLVKGSLGGVKQLGYHHFPLWIKHVEIIECKIGKCFFLFAFPHVFLFGQFFLFSSFSKKRHLRYYSVMESLSFDQWFSNQKQIPEVSVVRNPRLLDIQGHYDWMFRVCLLDTKHHGCNFLTVSFWFPWFFFGSFLGNHRNTIGKIRYSPWTPLG